MTLTLTLTQTLTLPLTLTLTLTLILTRMRALRALYDSVIGLLCAQLDTPPPSELVASEATEGGGLSAALAAATLDCATACSGTAAGFAASRSALMPR